MAKCKWQNKHFTPERVFLLNLGLLKNRLNPKRLRWLNYASGGAIAAFGVYVLLQPQ